MSQGWWTVEPGACAKAITTPLNSDTVYLLAQRKSGGTLVSGPQRFCTTVAAFVINGNANCTVRGFTEFRLCRHAHQRPQRLCRPYRSGRPQPGFLRSVGNVEIAEMPAHLFLAERKSDAAARRKNVAGGQPHHKCLDLERHPHG